MSDRSTRMLRGTPHRPRLLHQPPLRKQQNQQANRPSLKESGERKSVHHFFVSEPDAKPDPQGQVGPNVGSLGKIAVEDVSILAEVKVEHLLRGELALVSES